jgi:acylphosphatase
MGKVASVSSAAAAASNDSLRRLRTVIRGAVQGVGFRPFVFRLAGELGLKGWVNNSPQGVFIEAEGGPAELEQFRLRLEAEKPPRSFIQSLEAAWLDPLGYVLAVLGAIVLGVLLAAGAGDPNFAVVKIRAIIAVDHAHVIGLVDIDVAGDELDVVGVCQHHVVEDFQRELGELDGLVAVDGHLAGRRPEHRLPAAVRPAGVTDRVRGVRAVDDQRRGNAS